ncbi:hypothetical protein OIU85_028291 [Salix viminalis]|uniref:Uncharacterized protein n=1 Tax=Salix viminalis TaxID=40686 RepID=A0A9Q0QL42_SALVM|nr:hypothetical protein OIU85_028291 [Salix viminalis]
MYRLVLGIGNELRFPSGGCLWPTDCKVRETEQITETSGCSLAESGYVLFSGNDGHRNNVSIHMLMK